MIRNPLGFMQAEIAAFPELAHGKPATTGSISTFAKRVRSALRLIYQEQEILLFAALQWLFIGVAYFAWTQILGAIPDDVWRAIHQASEADDDGPAFLANTVLLIWSFLIIGLVSLPVGVLSGCMGAVYILRRTGQHSTIRRCLALASRRAWSLWIFHWIDGWITCEQIFERLPKKNQQSDPVGSAASEALYFAWKIGSAGIVPALLCGKSMVPAGKSSLGFLRSRFTQIATLRAGYALLCWVLGFGTYVLGVAALICFPDMWPDRSATGSKIEHFYVIAGFPLVIALAVVHLGLRPVYIIAISDLYVDYLAETKQQIDVNVADIKLGGVLSAGLALLAAVMFVVVIRDMLGITEMLATIIPATEVSSQ